MYNIFYMYATEIRKQYRILGTLNHNSYFQECLLIDSHDPIAIVLNEGLHLSTPPKDLLKDLVRCCIIKEENVARLLPVSEIIDRYR